MKYGFSLVGGEKENLEIFQSLLANFQNFKCLGVFRDREEALNSTLENPPSIIFLDIDKEFGIKNPFGFVHELHQYLEEIPVFVAVSGSKKKAYDVIKNNFQDFLLKPLNLFDLRKCLMKYEKANQSKLAQKICIRSYSDYRFLDLKDILFLKADNNTTDIFLTGNRKITAYKTLKHFEEKLPFLFLRVHHSYIVNTQHIVRINFGKWVITLSSDSSEIPFSRSYKPQVDHLKDQFFSPLSLVS